MILLLDTHVFLWWVNGEPIPPRAADLLSAREHDILFSAASAWEMTIKASIGKLALPEPVVGFVHKNLALNGFGWIGARHRAARDRPPLADSERFARSLLSPPDPSLALERAFAHRRKPLRPTLMRDKSRPDPRAAAPRLLRVRPRLP